MARTLITGGAGFVGANLCVELARRHPEAEIVAFDNLYRPGSKLNLPRLERAGVRFVEGDVRDRAALAAIDPIDVLIECSAEPSALAGMDGDTSYPFETNLVGAYNCLELARRDSAQFVFLSTSRVYPYTTLGELSLRRAETRFELEPSQPVAGISEAGISEAFPLDGARTLYGATKLSAELLVAEYAANFGLPTVVNRCGVIAGPWQMGKVDQGVFTFWLLHHLLRATAELHRLRRRRAAGARPAARRRPGRADRPAAGRPRALERLRRQRRRRPRGQPLAARDDRDLPRADRQRDRDRRRGRRAPRRRSAIYLRLLAPVRRAPNGDRRKSPREVLTDILAWVEENFDDVVASLGLR